MWKDQIYSLNNKQNSKQQSQSNYSFYSVNEFDNTSQNDLQENG